MITKDEILAVGRSALAQAFRDWLDENRQELLEVAGQRLDDIEAVKSA